MDPGAARKWASIVLVKTTGQCPGHRGQTWKYRKVRGVIPRDRWRKNVQGSRLVGESSMASGGSEKPRNVLHNSQHVVQSRGRICSCFEIDRQGQMRRNEITGKGGGAFPLNPFSVLSRPFWLFLSCQGESSATPVFRGEARAVILARAYSSFLFTWRDCRGRAAVRSFSLSRKGEMLAHCQEYTRVFDSIV